MYMRSKVYFFSKPGEAEQIKVHELRRADVFVLKNDVTLPKPWGPQVYRIALYRVMKKTEEKNKDKTQDPYSVCVRDRL